MISHGWLSFFYFSIHGKLLPPNVRVVAALNPYRKKIRLSSDRPASGLVFKLHEQDTSSMTELVYKVALFCVFLTLSSFVTTKNLLRTGAPRAADAARFYL